MKECERMSQKERKKNTILEKTKKDSNAPDSKKICRQQRMDVSESKHSTMMEDCSHRAELMAWWSMCDVQGGRGGTLTFVFCMRRIHANLCGWCYFAFLHSEICFKVRGTFCPSSFLMLQ